jgi:RimJ/RimL family protein N-acetyltransferase
MAATGRAKGEFVAETPRLRLRRLTEADAPFIMALLNDPDWIRFIGDRKVRSLDDARAYLRRAPLAMYERMGFGMYLAERREDGAPVGLCGLVKRDALEDVDVGFAFLSAYRGRGYALEATAAALAHDTERHAIKRVVAITLAENGPSIRLLERLGLAFERTIRLPDDPGELLLYAKNLPGAG